MNEEEMRNELQNALNTHGSGYVCGTLLGGGEYGQVFQVSKPSDRDTKNYAMKFLDTVKRDRYDPQKYNKRELDLLQTLGIWEQNVVQYYEHWNITVRGVEILCIKMELCWRSLHDFVYDNDMGCAKVIKAEGKPRLYQQVFPQILQGLKAIHSIGWVHRDIHYKNVLVASPKPSTISEIKIKIADFGLARKIESKSHSDKLEMEALSPFRGPFTAPELSSQKYDSKVDLYSAGIVLYFLSRYLEDKTQWPEEIKKLKNNAPFYDHLCFQDSNLITLIKSLTEREPNDRPTTEDALMMMKTSQDTENRPSAGVSFIVKKAGEQYWKRCTADDHTLPNVKDAIYECTGVEPKLQDLVQVTEITVRNNDAPKLLEFKISNNNDSEKMFLSANKEEREKSVCIVVHERMDTSLSS